MSCRILLRSQPAAALRQHSAPLTTTKLQMALHRLRLWDGHISYAAAQPDAPREEEQQQQQPPQLLQDDDFVGLLPDEDPEVPGTYMDAMNSNTKLGKAVRAAIEELEHLGDLETEVLQQCDDLLKKLGMKGSIFGSSPPPQMQQQQHDSTEANS